MENVAAEFVKTTKISFAPPRFNTVPPEVRRGTSLFIHLYPLIEVKVYCRSSALWITVSARRCVYSRELSANCPSFSAQIKEARKCFLLWPHTIVDTLLQSSKKCFPLFTVRRTYRIIIFLSTFSSRVNGVM